MALHAISAVSLITCKNEALIKLALQKHHQVLQRSENRQVTIHSVIDVLIVTA